MNVKRIWCVMVHVWVWRKYEIVESSTDPSVVGRIVAHCPQCGEWFRLWKAKHDPGKWLARLGGD